METSLSHVLGELKMSAKLHKCLHDIRTMSDRVTDAEKPQRKFIKMAILEMEKVRRSKEKNKARAQMINLDKRLAEIETEQAKLIETVYTVHQVDGPPATNAYHANYFISQDKQNNQYNTDFKITY
jgi:hypothetical protein